MADDANPIFYKHVVDMIRVAVSQTGIHLKRRALTKEEKDIEKWTIALDLFCVAKYVPSCTRMQLYLALKECNHADAKWMCFALDQFFLDCKGAYPPTTNVDIERFLTNTAYYSSAFMRAEQSEGHGGLGYYLAYRFSPATAVETRTILLEKAAEMGCGLARAAASYSAYPSAKRVSYAIDAATKRIPEGLWTLGWFHLMGRCVEKDYRNALHYISEAAHLGHRTSRYVIAMALSPLDPEKFTWFHMAALSGNVSTEYMDAMKEATNAYCAALGLRQWNPELWTHPAVRVIYTIGKNLNEVASPNRSHFYAEATQSDGLPYEEEAKIPLTVFDTLNRRTREAVDAWVGCARQLNCASRAVLPREIRKMVAEFVWASRGDGLYEVQFVDNSARCTRAFGAETREATVFNTGEGRMDGVGLTVYSGTARAVPYYPVD